MIYLKTILAVTTLTLLSSCSAFDKKTVTITKLVPSNIPTVSAPAKPQLISPKIYVVTEDNYDEFVTKFTGSNGELVFVAISIKDYENLSINLEEIKAYILKQKEVIVYYEDAIADSQITDQNGE